MKEAPGRTLEKLAFLEASSLPAQVHASRDGTKVIAEVVGAEQLVVLVLY